MPNDLIRLACEQAAESFGGNDGTFNLAGLSAAICRIADVQGPIDGRICRVLLTGMADVEPGLSTSHFRIRMKR
jgi:hypothetical protein